MKNITKYLAVGALALALTFSSFVPASAQGLTQEQILQLIQQLLQQIHQLQCQLNPAACDATPIFPTPAPEVIGIGSRVITTDTVKVRECPGLDCRATAVRSKGSLGVVAAGPKVAGDYTWWQVNFDNVGVFNPGSDGWVAANYLVVSAKPPIIISPYPPVGLNIISPNGGEAWYIGKTQTIKWKYYAGLVGNVHMFLVSADNDRFPDSDDCYLGSAPISQGEFSLSPLSRSGTCRFYRQDLLTGVYKIWMYADNGNPDQNTWVIKDQSDSYFKIYDTGSQPANLPPSISGISGPVQLRAGETGTWTVRASDPENQPLSYWVWWGDEAVSVPPQPLSSNQAQTATFTHTYTQKGTYNPTFTVTDSTGQSVKTSISVQVGDNVISSNRLKVIYPNGHEVLKVGEQSKIMWASELGVSPFNKLDIWLLDEPTRLGKIIFSGVMNDGSEPWIVKPLDYITDKNGQTSLPSGQYVILIGCTDNNCIVDDSDNSFVILQQNSTTIPTPTIIPTISSSNPPNGAIDARSPQTESFSVPDGVWEVMSMGLTASNYDSVALSNYSVNSTISEPIRITRIRLDDNPYTRDTEYALGFSRYGRPGERITIQPQKPLNGSPICVGFLPGDVNQDGIVNYADATFLNDYIGPRYGPRDRSLPLYQVDINRDGAVTTTDLTAWNEVQQKMYAQGTYRLSVCPSGTIGAVPASSQYAATAQSLSGIQALLANLRATLLSR